MSSGAALALLIIAVLAVAGILIWLGPRGGDGDEM